MLRNCLLFALCLAGLLPARAQSDSTSVYGIFGGVSVNRMVTKDGWQYPSTTWQGGLSVNRLIGRHWYGTLLLGYWHHNQPTFDTRFRDYQFQQDVVLHTSFKQNGLQLTLLGEKQAGRFSVGAGVRASFLLASWLNQSVANSSDTIRNIHGKYTLHRNTVTGYFNHTNIAPVVRVGYRFTPRLSLHYTAGLDLLRNPIDYYFTNYYLFSHAITVTLKIK